LIGFSPAAVENVLILLFDELYYGQDRLPNLFLAPAGNETPSVEYLFVEVELVKMIYHPYAIGEENGIPLYICRQPKRNIQHWWKDYESYIFD